MSKPLKVEIEVLGKPHVLKVESEDETMLERTLSLLRDKIDALEHEGQAPRSPEALLLVAAFELAAELAKAGTEMERLRGMVESFGTLDSME